MNVGLIDIDRKPLRNRAQKKHAYPTLTLMKLSAWHKAKGDSVQLINAEDVLCGSNLFNPYDKVYASCIFDWNKPVAEELAKVGVVVGGSGYDYSVTLPQEIEHIFPDYSLYGINDTAYGYMSRGCPRGCPFCIVKHKEGLESVKVADLNEFWSGQRNIVLNDPNLLACDEWENILQQLIDSNSWIDVDQGLDARLLTKQNTEMINQLKVKMLHFAWDNPRDTFTQQKLLEFREQSKLNFRNLRVYVLANYWSTPDEDLMRIYWLRENGFDPYLMVFDKAHAPREVRRMQRWVNNKILFRVCERLEDVSDEILRTRRSKIKG